MLVRKRGRPKGFPTKIVAYGKESVERKVGKTGNCGRVYVPPSWAGKRVLIIRLNEEVYYDDRQRDQA